MTERIVGTCLIEIGFSGDEGYHHLNEASRKLEQLISEYPWLSESLEEIAEHVAMAGASIGVAEHHQQREPPAHGDDLQT